MLSLESERDQFWFRKLIGERKEKGEFHQLAANKIEELINPVGPFTVTNYRNRVPVSLRHLATGYSHLTITFRYRMSPTAAGRIVSDTNRNMLQCS